LRVLVCHIEASPEKVAAFATLQQIALIYPILGSQALSQTRSTPSSHPPKHAEASGYLHLGL